MHTTDEGTEYIDILFVTPEDNLDFCCKISSTDYEFDELPSAGIYDKTGKNYLGVIRMDHRPETENDFEECGKKIPQKYCQSILQLYFSGR